MNQNPLEQQKVEISILKKQIENKFSGMFDDRDKLSSSINDFISQLEFFEKTGLVFDKEKMVKSLKESVGIQDREVFLAQILKILEPFLILKITQPKIFEKAQRQSTLNWKENIKLSEVLYISRYKLNDENEEVFIHLPPAKDLMTKDKIEYFQQEIKNGLIKLAEIIKPYPNIKKILASSWIIATPRGRERLEDLGFTFSGMVPETENDAGYFDSRGNRKPFADAFMTREDFLVRYGGAS